MRKLSVILLLMGILIVAIPILGQAYTRYQENKMMDEWLNSVDGDLPELDYEIDPEDAYAQLQDAFLAETEEPESRTDEAAGGDGAGTGAQAEGQAGADGGGDASAGAAAATASGSKSGVSNQKVLGIIQIKKIKVKAPIVEGVKSYNLASAVGHIPGTAALGEPGNSALAGHRSYTFGKFFNRLDEIEIDDEIIITTKKEDMKYKVTKIHIVTPDDVSVLKGSKDESVITLITCTPIYVATHRLIVVATLEERVLKEP